jgi:hypothetical protein
MGPAENHAELIREGLRKAKEKRLSRAISADHFVAGCKNKIQGRAT